MFLHRSICCNDTFRSHDLVVVGSTAQTQHTTTPLESQMHAVPEVNRVRPVCMQKVVGHDLPATVGHDRQCGSKVHSWL